MAETKLQPSPAAIQDVLPVAPAVLTQFRIRRSFLIIGCLLLFIAQAAFAQNGTLKGTVVNETNTPLPSASVSVKETKTGATADATGQFTITASVGQTLLVSAVGYTPER